MTVLYIVFGILLFICFLLFFPLSLVFDYGDDLFAYVRICGIKIKLAGGKAKQKKQKSEEKPKKRKRENFFKSKIKERGISTAISDFVNFAQGVWGRVGFILSHIAVRDFCLCVRVAGSDAAMTAIEYGAVCSVLYPFLNFLYTQADFKMKQVDVVADFDGKDSDIRFHIKLKTRPIIPIIAAVGFYGEYLKLTEDEKNERK